MGGVITVDLDYPTGMEIVSAYNFLSNVSDDVRFRESSHKGVHLEADTESSFYKRMYARFLCGDDFNRMFMDYARFDDGFDTEVLWDEKDENECGDWKKGWRDLFIMIDNMIKESRCIK